MVGIGLTDQFDDDLNFFPVPSTNIGGGSRLGGGHTDIALLDTGAAVSLITTASDAAFNIRGPYPGESDGYRGTEPITIGGATGFLEARIGDPLGLFAAGLQNRTGAGASLSIPNSAYLGQTNSSIITVPPESDLPNVLGLSFASQYATRIRNSQPQVFELNGKTVRTPAIDFLPLGTGNAQGIARKAPMSLLGDSPSTPLSFPNLGDFNLDKPYEDPSQPTFVQGGHFLNVNLANNGAQLTNSQFFFDTGASVTVVSELTALQLGFDVVLDEPDFTIAIVGSGGVSEGVPGFYLDQFTVQALGGSIVLNNVPVLVLDVTNPANPGNIVPGIVGTNVFAGRDIVIDPNPSLGGGGASAGVYISDPVTTTHNWVSPAATGAWSTGGNWSGSTSPTILGVANLRHVAGSDQVATLAGDRDAWEVNISGGAGGQTMTLRLDAGAELTTFTGVNVEAGGVLSLADAVVDAQYVQIYAGGRLTGEGAIRTGSGPIPGQVENAGGLVAPGDAASGGIGSLAIAGRFSNTATGKIQFELAGLTAGTQHDELLIDGPAAFGGALEVLLSAGFTPSVGDTFTIATYDEEGGRFDSATLPAGITWGIGYGETSLTLSVFAPGDFNGSGFVDAADYTVWRDGLGTFYTQADYTLWKANFGNAAVAGLASAGVPEPSSLVLIGVLLLAGTRVYQRS
ncbi:hypothetical protein Pla175_41120 [Pirellulimonas nuda]|uniref:Peptidase A2 domain-containing protein n=2 Tax=Pirellulimonas nuda TaxID=2528009 RepID=A0A518DGY8_9BACT|nr:hypothetical protein Pla175_41120 [Pirellulimonas nuda]